jgi:RNA polymerase sigma-70 factor (ECF subfamily)
MKAVFLAGRLLRMSSDCIQVPEAPWGAGAQWRDGDSTATVAEDDPLAFSELMSRHREALLRCIRRYVGGSDDALDVLQETFFSAWMALGHYDRHRPFLVWIRTIAVNKCRDRARRTAVRAAVFGPWTSDEMLEIADSRPGPPELLESEQALDRLRSSLAKLPVSLRKPLLLTTLEGMSHRQAGHCLGISAKAVELRIYRARMRLEALHASPASRP